MKHFLLSKFFLISTNDMIADSIEMKKQSHQKHNIALAHCSSAVIGDEENSVIS